MPLPKLKLLLLRVPGFFILMYAIISPTAKLFSQTSNAYESISTAQGLSQGMIFDILQDKEGFIWMATKNGLNRYDGYNFTVFTNDPYNPHSLSSNTVTDLFEDTKGRIWVGTEDAGLNVYDKSNGKFHRITYNSNDPYSLSGNDIKSIEQLPDGRIIVAVVNGGFNIITIDNNFFIKDAAPSIKRISLPHNAQVDGMGKDRTGTMWIGGMDGIVYSFNVVNNSFVKRPGAQLCNNGYFTQDSSLLINKQLFLSTNKALFPLFDPSKTPAGNIVFKPLGNPWLGFHREIRFYDVSKWQPDSLVNWSEKLPAASRLLYPFIIDRSGMIWTGTVGYGLRKYNTVSSKFQRFLPRYSIRWIVPAGANDIFLGDYAYGWRKLSNDAKEDTAFNNKSLAGIQIDNFIASKKGDFWIKSDIMGFIDYDPSTGKYIKHPEINDDSSIGNKQPMLEDSRSNIWMPGLGGHFTLFNTTSNKSLNIYIGNAARKPLPSNAVCTALYEDDGGVYWIGTQQGFAKIVFTGNGKNSFGIKWFSNNSNSRNSLNYNHVSCFLDDPSKPGKYLWICTKGGGLNRLDKSSGDFFHFTSKDGLPDDVVYGVLADETGNIWGSTNRGIFCLVRNKTDDVRSWTIRKFSKDDGLQDDEFNTCSFAKLPDGKLAFGGVNGLNIFNPKDVLSSHFSPNVFITDILINNQPVLPGDKTGLLQTTIEETKSITLNHLQDILTLEFSSLDFTKPDQNQYRYKLDGADKDWVPSGTRRTATYLHLPAGKYTFEVQGTNSQAIWSDKIAKLNIRVLPPWWETWWAYTLYILLFASIIIFITRAQQQRVFQKEQQRNKLLELEMQALRAQMNPHFIFNCLSSINRFVLMNETEAASDYLTKFSKLIRMVLNNSKKPLITLDDEMIMLRLYLDMERLRFQNGFNYTIYINDDVESQNIFIPPLIFQPFAENAVWHGLMHKKDHGQLTIRLSVEDNILNFEIEDNGVGRDAASSVKSKSAQKNKSLGLQITKERLSLINGYISEENFFKIKDLVDENGNATGTKVILKIKFNETANA